MELVVSDPPIVVDVYDVLEIKVGDGVEASDPLAVEVQPAGAAGCVKFLLLESSGKLDDLECKLRRELGEADAIDLKSAQVFTSPKEVGLLRYAPEWLYFTSGPGNDAKVKMVVGRAAIGS